MGLVDIMAQLYAEGWESTDETAEEIIRRLEDKNNYIPLSERVRREYQYALLKEYKKYLQNRFDKNLKTSA
ncbi:MAG: hypothetical protein P8Y38_02160 [Deltaproteobacteria bacterium]